MTQEHLIPTPGGHAEVRLQTPRSPRQPATAALVCHPHPLYGGSMDNKVVYTLAKTFLSLGATVMRFNFRGVGQSRGLFDHGDGETADAIALAAWLREHTRAEILWLAGFSFGAYVALRAHQPIQPRRLVLVAPPVRRFGAEALGDVPTLVIQGDRDTIVEPAGVEAWLQTQTHPATYRLLPAAEHFFHKQLGVLQETVTEWMT